MSTIQQPVLNINLTPKYNDSEEVARIAVNLTIGGLYRGLQGGNQWNQNEALLFTGGNTENFNRYTEDTKVEDIRATDDQGPFTITIHAGFNPGQTTEWKTDRPIQGTVTITYDAKTVLDDAKSWNVKALRRDSGGLVGVLSSFIPCPLVAEDTICDVGINWDLGHSPIGIRAINTFGEDIASRRISALKPLLDNCAIMVGKITSFPSGPPGDEATGNAPCGTYWLGDPPANLLALKDFSNNMFPRLSAFFKDENGSYRTFLRKVPRGLYATPLLSSSLIDYDEDTKIEHDWDLVKLLNSSMVSTWARLDNEDDGSSNDWFTQGLSLLYTIYLPYRFGQRTPNYFRATLNGFLSGYFTNPLTPLPLSKIPPSSSSWHAASAASLRSCIYMIRMDAFTRRASVARNTSILRPIDEIIAEICVRRRRGNKVQEGDWITYIGEWIGQDAAAEHLQNMKDGMVMDLEDMKTAFDGIDVEEQRVLDMGFDRASLTTGVVGGVVGGSEAYEAGLRDGDRILWTSRLEICETHYESRFRLVVERSGNEVNIEYWPRSDKTVKVWQSKKKHT